MRRAEESSADSHTCEIWISCLTLIFLISLSFDSFFSISASQAPPVPASTVAVDSSAQQFSPLNTVRCAHTRLTCERASKLLSNRRYVDDLLGKACFSSKLFALARRDSSSQARSQQGWNEIGKKKRKKAISLIKRWFFTVDRLSWS